MQFLKELFSHQKHNHLNTVVDKMLARLRIDSMRQLPDGYLEAIIEVSQDNFKPKEVFRTLVKKIQTANTAPTMVKLFTIIFSLLKQSKYADYYLEELQDLDDLRCPQGQEITKTKWMKQLSICCFTYLGRISSMGDLYTRARGYNQMLISQKTMQTDLFRMLNIYSLLFPMLGQVTNTVGRYLKQQSQYYFQFYRIVRGQLMIGYTYMRYICDFYLKSHHSVSVGALEYFSDIIGELEVLGDSMEDFFLNKYFKAAKMGKRLYFKEQEVQKMRYYLGLRRGKKEDQMVETADSEVFGNAKLRFTLTLNN